MDLDTILFLSVLAIAIIASRRGGGSNNKRYKDPLGGSNVFGGGR